MAANTKKLMTLCMIVEPPRILLAMKKRGFGKGKWNGYGGKVQAGESIEDAAKRETYEEAGITITDMEFRGINEFEFRGDPVILEVHVFYVAKFEGTPVETEEMSPQWFDLDQLPYKDMWKDDPLWLPIFLAGKRFKGRYLFDENENILEYSVK